LCAPPRQPVPLKVTAEFQYRRSRIGGQAEMNNL
jgi:hypothetical protein